MNDGEDIVAAVMKRHVIEAAIGVLVEREQMHEQKALALFEVLVEAASRDPYTVAAR